MAQRAGRADEPHRQGSHPGRFHYEAHEQLRRHLADFVDAYNFARRLETSKGLTLYQTICRAWINDAKRFILDPLQQMPGLNTWRVTENVSAFATSASDIDARASSAGGRVAQPLLEPNIAEQPIDPIIPATHRESPGLK